MGVRYRWNGPGVFGEQVLRSEGMKAAMESRADKIKAEFEATAPVGAPYENDEHRGRYRDSAIVDGGVDGGINGDRAYGRVTVNDPAAMQIEYGHVAAFDAQGRPVKHGEAGEGGRTVYVEGSHTLTTAMDAAGG